MAWISRMTVAAVLLPQLPALLWWLGTHSSLYQRGWINLEYLVLLCVALLWPSRITVGLLTAELCLMLVEPLAHLYYFHPGDILLSLRYLRFLPAGRMAEYGALLLVYTACCAAGLRWAVGRSRHSTAGATAAAIVVFTLIAAAAGLRVRGYSLSLQSDASDVRSQRRLVRAPMISMLVAMYGYSHDQSGPGYVPLPSALEHAMTDIPSGAQPDIVLVVTESWGLAVNPKINLAQTEPYSDSELKARYRVITGTVRFDGPTTSGETRELCGNAEGIASVSASASYYASCWPAKLNQAGYRTIAVHGFTPTMFHRDDWYQKFGFRQSVFLPQLQQEALPMCGGAFPGICDADVAAWIGRRLFQPAGDPVFIHWVTLNSHLPVPPIADAVGRDHCAAAGIVDQEGLCSWFNLVLRVHQSVAQLAMVPRRPTVFIVVGDHAPPFMRAEARARFSQTSVPYVILMPRVLGNEVRTRTLQASSEGEAAATRGSIRNPQNPEIRR